MEAVVLDAWAVVAFLKGEPEAAAVDARLVAGDCVMSSVNLGEALYSVARTHGWETARDRVSRLRRRLRAEDPDWALVTDAAALKARGLSFPDAFCVATAQRHRAPLWTGDPELVALGELVEVVDLR